MYDTLYEYQVKTSNFWVFYKPTAIKQNNELHYFIEQINGKTLNQRLQTMTHQAAYVNTGIIVIPNCLPEYTALLANEIKKWIQCDCCIQEKTPTRIKITHIHSYIFNNTVNKKKPILFQKLMQIANGIRKIKDCCSLPSILQRLKSSIHSKYPSLPETNQISVIQYINPTDQTIYCSIDGHKENEKFDSVVGLYFGKSSKLSLDLFWNRVNGEFSIELPSRSIAIFNSM